MAKTLSKKKVGSKAAQKVKPQRMEHKLGMKFPISRIHRLMKRDRLSLRIGKQSAVMMTGILEYMCQELCEISGSLAEEAGKKRINARHITLGLQNDDELLKIFGGAIIYQGGVKPHIEKALLPDCKP